jgi:hypothetical protein
VPQQLPTDTLELLARTFFKDAGSYGFTQLDYVRFVNALLDLSIRNDHQFTVSVTPPASLSKADMRLSREHHSTLLRQTCLRKGV